MTPTALPTGAPWLRRALALSAVLHLAATLTVWWATAPRSASSQLVDIEIAPEAPKVEALPPEIEKRAEPAADEASTLPEPPPVEPAVPKVPIDAGVADARQDAARKPDAAKPDAAVDAGIDAAVVGDAGDVQPTVAMNEGSAGSDSGSAAGSGSGSGSDSGSGSENLPAVPGAPTTPGTAANLLAYFPTGHLVTALIRFDRVRGTEWAQAAERMFRPMPDYHNLFGDHDAAIADKIDTLVISTPQPRDATATTLVAHTRLGRGALRDLLSANPIAWSSAKGGMLGVRGGKLFPGDKRVLLSPWAGWFLLAQPQDLGAMTTATAGDIDTVQARGTLPPWVGGIRAIEAESGDPSGPALVVTLALGGGRMNFPDIGVGLTTLPRPERASLAMELVPQGWRALGNMKFASEADADEFVRSVEQAKRSVVNGIALKLVLRRQHVWSAIDGLTLARTGARVSYGTSLSIADARALLAAIAATLDQYFQRP